MMKRRLFSCLFNFFLAVVTVFSSSSSWAEVKAYLNQDNYYEGDPVTLTVKTNNNNLPDLSVLNKNFEQLGVTTSSQINVINGRRSFNKNWTIELQPRVKGKIEIPGIQIGNEKTKPLVFTISDLPPEIKAETSKHVFIESSIKVTDDGIYVQQQIPYTVKLFYDSAMMSGDISPLDVKNAVVEQLGLDKRYTVTKNGKKFNVLEKHYVISPEKSGLLEIPATVVKGRIALSGGDSPKLRRRMDETDMLNRFFNDFGNDPFLDDPFGGFFSKRRQGPSKPFSTSADAITVNILPVPDTFSGSAWLPAEGLSIKDSWTKQPPELKVGEPVTRRLVLQAKGLAGSQIPEILLPKPTSVKVYPEPAKTETRTDGKTLFGIQQLDVTYIPNAQGKVEIPALKIDWWNIKNKKQETFILPAWNLNIAAGTQSTMPVYEAEPDIILKENKSQKADINTHKVADVTDTSWLIKLLVVMTFIAILGLISRWIYSKYTKFQAGLELPHLVINKVEIDRLHASLLDACHGNDKRKIASLIIPYVQVLWGDSSIQSLGAIATRLDDDGKTIIRSLEQSLYASQAVTWRGDKLYSLLNKGFLLRVGAVEATHKQDNLEPLYPI